MCWLPAQMPVLLRGSQGYCESQIFSFFKKPLQVLGVTIEQMMALVQGLSFRPPQPPLPRKLSLLFPLRISRGSSQGGQDAGTHHSDQAPRRPSLRGTGGPAPSLLRTHGSRARGHLHRVPHCPPPAPHPHCPREVVLFLGGQPAEGTLGPVIVGLSHRVHLQLSLEVHHHLDGRLQRDRHTRSRREGSESDSKKGDDKSRVRRRGPTLSLNQPVLLVNLLGLPGATGVRA